VRELPVQTRPAAALTVLPVQSLPVRVRWPGGMKLTPGALKRACPLLVISGAT
jgi:hypothetical protein